MKKWNKIYKEEKIEEAGVWTPIQEKQVKELDKQHLEELIKLGIDPYSKEAGDIWKKKYKAKFAKIFDKKV